MAGMTCLPCAIFASQLHKFVQLVYQTTVFLSRSSISMGIPALPSRFLSVPAIVQAVILLALAFESGVGIFNTQSEVASIGLVFTLISLEGICGGLA